MISKTDCQTCSRWFVACVLVCLPGGSHDLFSQEPGGATLSQPAKEFVSPKDQLADDLRFLTSEKLKGRSAVDPTIQIAAEYLANRFKSIGLDTSLFNGTPFQPFDIPVGPVAEPGGNRLAITLSGTEVPSVPQIPVTLDTELGQQFMPLAIGANQVSVRAGVVWVGYGIRAEEHDYDDYGEVSVQGKLVMMLRKEPGAANPSSPFNGVKNTRHAFFATKVLEAIDQGAAGVLLVNDPASVKAGIRKIDQRRDRESKRLEQLKGQIEELPAEAKNIREGLLAKQRRSEEMLLALQDETVAAQRGILDISEAGLATIVRPATAESSSSDAAPNKSAKRMKSKVRSKLSGATSGQKTARSVPVVSISRQLADRMLRESLAVDQENGLEGIEAAIDSDFKPRSLALPSVEIDLQVAMTPSMVKSSNVIATLPGKGDLAGESIVVGAHYDHVGMGGPGSLAPGTIEVHNGADDNASGTAALLRVAEVLVSKLESAESHRRVVFIAFTGEERGLLGSRHYVAQPRFPLSSTVAMINMDMVGRLRDNELTVYGTGTAPQFDGWLSDHNEASGFDITRIASGYGPSDHKTFYEAGLPVLFFFTGLHQDYHRPSDDFDRLNLDGMIRITDIVGQVSEQLATTLERPEYAKTDQDIQIRRQLTVYMGVVLSQESGEVVFSSIAPGGPAEQAGLQQGDRLAKAGKKPIKEIGQFMEALRRCSPGDKLSLTLERDGQRISKTVKLRAR